MSVSDCITTYSTTYTCFYWLCRTNASAMSQCREPGRPETADVLCQWHRRDRDGDMSSWARLVEGCGSMWIHVDPWCFQVASCPGWKSLKKSYLQQDLQTNLCEELDKRVPVVSGASSSRTASEWIEVARKRSWTPSARISGAAHISIWSYYLECILLHCLPTSEMDNSSIWESLLKTSIVMIWSFFLPCMLYEGTGSCRRARSDESQWSRPAWRRSLGRDRGATAGRW